MIEFKRFDASEYLHTEVGIAEYLTAALEDPNPQIFVAALGDVAKARGLTENPNQPVTGSQESKLQFDTVRGLVAALGVKLVVEPAVDHIES
jgi:probable addiction module antidote protein